LRSGYRPDLNGDPGTWERIALQNLAKSLPGEVPLLTPTLSPLEPAALGFLDNEQQAIKVAVHAEVVDVPLDAPLERGVLRLLGLMPMATAPGPDGHDCPR
jgi:hypothetical protein